MPQRSTYSRMGFPNSPLAGHTMPCSTRQKHFCSAEIFRFPSHSAVIAAFGQHFVKTGILDASLHRHFLEAFDLRNLADYGAVRTIENADVHSVLENAKAFASLSRIT